MTINFTPHGVCSRQINIEVTDGIVQSVEFIGGCNGNGKGVASLCKGMRVEDVIARLSDIKCGGKTTSCPAQLAIALQETL